MKTDILLNQDGDIHVAESDIAITQSIQQAVMVRLQWLLGEWRFFPDAGIPYIEEVLVKKPDIERLRRHIYETARSVEGVNDVLGINISVDKAGRTASASLTIVTDEENYRLEVANHVRLDT